VKRGVYAPSIIALGVIAALQTGYFLVPDAAVVAYNRVLPVFYAIVLLVHVMLMGRERFPAPKATNALYAGMFILLLYIFATLFTGVVAGFAANRDSPNTTAILENFWIFGTPAILFEVLRFRIMRSNPNSRLWTAAFMIIVFSFSQLNIIRGGGFGADSQIVKVVFVTLIPAFVMHTVLTYMAYESSLKALIIVRCLFLFPFVSPVIPNAASAAWAAVTCGVLFIATIIYYFTMQEPGGKFRKAAVKRLTGPIPPALILSMVLALILALSFFMRAFTYFPTVVLTSSMTGALDRGSFVIVKKLTPKDVIQSVEEGEVVLFKDGGLEVMHRVIEIKAQPGGTLHYITQGDANPRPDSDPAYPEQIIGRAHSHIPYIGWPVVIVRSVFG